MILKKTIVAKQRTDIKAMGRENKKKIAWVDGIYQSKETAKNA